MPCVGSDFTAMPGGCQGSVSQAGVPAVCDFGEDNLEAGGIKRLAEIGVKAIRIVPDLDAAGDDGLARSSEIVRKGGLKASAAQLPDE